MVKGNIQFGGNKIFDIYGGKINVSTSSTINSGTFYEFTYNKSDPYFTYIGIQDPSYAPWNKSADFTKTSKTASQLTKVPTATMDSFFNAAQASLNNQSQKYNSYKTPGVYDNGKTLALNATNTTLDPKTIAASNGLGITDFSPFDTIIINLPLSKVPSTGKITTTTTFPSEFKGNIVINYINDTALNTFYPQGNSIKDGTKAAQSGTCWNARYFSGRLIHNFPDASTASVQVTGSAGASVFIGSILAPYSNVSVAGSGNCVDGDIVCASYTMPDNAEEHSTIPPKNLGVLIFTNTYATPTAATTTITGGDILPETGGIGNMPFLDSALILSGMLSISLAGTLIYIRFKRKKCLKK